MDHNKSRYIYFAPSVPNLSQTPSLRGAGALQHAEDRKSNSTQSWLTAHRGREMPPAPGTPEVLWISYEFPMESTLTIKFRGAEAELLDRLVRSGLFATKSEAVRSALVKYGADLGLLRAKDLRAALETVQRRRVTEAQPRKDVKKAEDAD